jgi:Amt family ammonium transporter
MADGKKENVISTILQSFIAMGVITVVWVVIGFGLAFGDSIGGIVGNPSKFLSSIMLVPKPLGLLHQPSH